MTAADLGYASENPIYVNESLTPANQKLLSATRAAAKQKKYKYVWTYECTIYVRRNSDTEAIRISSALDLEKL